MEAVFDYWLGPFRLRSALALPALKLASSGFHDITLALATGAEPALESLPPQAVAITPYAHVWPGACLLNIPAVGSFLVRNGNELVLALEPGAPAADMQSYVMGWCFGALCHQRGLLPLHAGAVDFGQGLCAFLGDSGAGKSTLVASLSRQGMPIVSDDICLLAPAANAAHGLDVLPYGQYVKLWQTSLDFLGEPADPALRTFADDEKFRVALPSVETRQSGLTRLLVLARGDALRLETLSASQALAAMLDHVYLGYCTEAMGVRERLFAQCAQVLAHARPARLVVPWGLEHVPATVEFLERVVFHA